jgi:hypothetical protein
VTNENLNAGFVDEKLYWGREAPQALVAGLRITIDGNGVLVAERLE